MDLNSLVDEILEIAGEEAIVEVNGYDDYSVYFSKDAEKRLKDLLEKVLRK